MRIHHQGHLLLAGLALSAALGATTALAQDQSADTASGVIRSYDAADYDLLPPTRTFRLDTPDRFYQQGIGGDPRVRGNEASKRIYFGGSQLDGNRASGTDIKRGGLYLELNQRGAELLFRF